MLPVHVLLDLRGEQRRLLGSSLRWAGVSTCVGEAMSNARKSWERAEEGVRPEATAHTAATFGHGTPEQGRTLSSILVLGRCVCQGKRVEFILVNTMLT